MMSEDNFLNFHVVERAISAANSLDTATVGHLSLPSRELEPLPTQRLSKIQKRSSTTQTSLHVTRQMIQRAL